MQQRHVVHFARVARLDDQRAARARAFAHQMMVHAGRRQQARNRRELVARRRGPTGSGSCSPRRPPALACVFSSSSARSRPGRAVRGAEQHRQRHRAETLGRDVPQLGQLARCR